MDRFGGGGELGALWWQLGVPELGRRPFLDGRAAKKPRRTHSHGMENVERQMSREPL